MFVKYVSNLAVALRVVDEIPGRWRLTFRHYIHKLFNIRELQCIICFSLLANRRHRFCREVFATCRTCAMRGVHTSCIWQREQFVVQRIEQHSSQLVGSFANRYQQVGPANIADKHRVACEHPIWHFVVRVLEHHDGNRLGRMARSMADLEDHLAKNVPLAVGKRACGKLRFSHCAVSDGCTSRLGQFQVSGQEVGMKMRLED